MHCNTPIIGMGDDCLPGKAVIEIEYNPHEFENFTTPFLPDSIPVWEISLKVAFYVFAFLLDVVGNTIVILIIIVNKRMRTSTNILILNLAVSDLMVAAFCMWVHLGNKITPEWPFGSFMCKVNTFMQVVAVSSSVLNMTSISVERFFAIVFPLVPRMTPWMTTVVISTNWFLAVAIAIPHLFVRIQYEYYWANRHQVWCTENWPKVYTDEECNTESIGRTIYYTIEVVFVYFVPIFVMVIAYILILVKMLRRNRPGSTTTTLSNSQQKSRKKVIRMLVVILVVFVCCWTPQQVLIIWDIYRPKYQQIPEYLSVVKYIAVYTAYLNSAINPVLYAGFNENFRKGFRDAFNCHLWTRRNAVAPGRNNQGSNTTAVGGSLV